MKAIIFISRLIICIVMLVITIETGLIFALPASLIMDHK